MGTWTRVGRRLDYRANPRISELQRPRGASPRWNRSFRGRRLQGHRQPPIHRFRGHGHEGRVPFAVVLGLRSQQANYTRAHHGRWQMRSVISARTQSIVLSCIAAVWLVLGLALPFGYIGLLPVGVLVVGARSFLIRCLRCRQSALRRRVDVFGETWTVGWFLAPRTCLTCGQDLTVPAGTLGATTTSPDRYRQEAWSPRKLAKYLALCGAAGAGGALLAWRDREVLIAVGGLVLAASLCLTSGIIWFRARRSP